MLARFELLADFLSAGRASDHPRGFLVGRQPAVGCELIDQVRQLLAQTRQEVLSPQAGLLGQRVERIVTERIRQVVGCNLLVWTSADPGLGRFALPARLELLDELVE